MKKSGKKQDLVPITEKEASRLLISLSIYVVLEETHQSTTLLQLIKRLLKDNTPAEEILIGLMAHEDVSLEDRIRELIDVADAHLEKNRLIRQTRNQGRSRRLTLPGPERYELANKIQKEYDLRLRDGVPPGEIYAELSEQSEQLFGYNLSAGQIDGRHRWIQNIPYDECERYEINWSSSKNNDDE